MSEALKVLIVEDEPTMAALLKKMVMRLGCEEIWVCSSDVCALETAQREEIDLIFMDLNIEGSMDGIRCAKQITMQKDVSIVFATSHSDEATLEEAMDINTLNYLIKPYGKKDIEITLNLARFAQKKRRRTPKKPEEPRVQVGNDYLLDMIARRLTYKGAEVALSKKEFALLALLAKNQDTTVQTDQILLEVWQNRAIAASTLRETVTRVRKKLPNVEIKAVHGVGYRLNFFN